MERRPCLLIIAIEEHYLTLLSQQIQTIFKDSLVVRTITVEKMTQQSAINVDCILLSNSFVYPFVKVFFEESTPILISKQTINLVNIKPILDLPDGQTILVVNSFKENTEEAAETLNEIIKKHHFIPYYPEQPINQEIEYIVTPGETHLVPAFFKKVINIGPRILSYTTILELIEACGITTDLNEVFWAYMKSHVAVTSGTTSFVPITSYSTPARQKLGTFNDFFYKSKQMQDLIQKAKSVSLTNEPTHVVGEPGTGKRLLCEAIYCESSRQRHKFKQIDCSELTPDNLNHVIFENSLEINLYKEDSTLFLKGVETLTIPVQNQILDLLNLIQKNQTENKIRIMSSSSIDLTALLETGLFNRELYHLLTKNLLRIPPLRDRIEDLEACFVLFKQKYYDSHLIFSEEALNELKNYVYPGNMRELFHILTYCSFVKESPISSHSLPHYFRLSTQVEEESLSNQNFSLIIKAIEKHQFLEESLSILNILYSGKQKHTSYGRLSLQKLLFNHFGIELSEQQLRQRLKTLENHGLVIVRQGRAGSTISKLGQLFLENANPKRESSKRIYQARLDG